VSQPIIVPFFGKAPKIHDSAFIAPGACIIGDVEIGPDSSIWYNCVLRGDINRIVIGARTNVQDGTIIHVEGSATRTAGSPTLVGDDALVGHMAILHGCMLEDRAFVGMGAIVMDDCRIGCAAMLAAGALLTTARAVPEGELWAGRPARFTRELTEEERASMLIQSHHYVDNAIRHRTALASEMRAAADGTRALGV
jgi:carbonic anhydrase/acetyltransferase-like protein (isoleucine patch superfamily)